jgi:hypothetical protein
MIKVGCSVVRQLPNRSAQKEFDLKSNESEHSDLQDICHLIVVQLLSCNVNTRGIVVLQVWSSRKNATVL